MKDYEAVEKLIRESACFGKFFEESVPECKACDLKTVCEAKTASNLVYNQNFILNPATEKYINAHKQEVEKRKEGKSSKTTKKVGGARKLKGKSIEQLEEILEELGGECEKHENKAVYKFKLLKAILQLS